MRVAVIGSRHFRDYEFLCAQLDWFLLAFGPFTVVNGIAEGADTLAVRWANERKLPFPEVFPADWHPHGSIKMDRSAGIRRNKDVIESCDCVIAFWDRRSPGTKNSLDVARRLGKSVYILWPP